MNERIRELAEQAKLRPELLLKHRLLKYCYWGAIDALTDSEQEEISQLEQFAELVKADEREACAKLCDQIANDYDGSPAGTGADNCATAIRAMKAKLPSKQN